MALEADDDEYAPALTPYTRADASYLAETPGVKRLDPGVRVLGVAARDEATGAPRVLLCHPLRAQRLHDPSPRALERSLRARKWRGRGRANDAPSPWPNVFWLVDRETARRVGRLEHGGGVRRLQRAADDDVDGARALFSEQHARYGRFRWSLLSDEEREMCEGLGGEHVETLRDGGVGGYVPGQVKCLHAHYACHLATGGRHNVVGRWVQEMLDRGEDEDSAKAQRARDEERALARDAGAVVGPKVKGAEFNECNRV